MVHLHFNFMDGEGIKLNTPFVLVNDFPVLPRIGDTIIIDIEQDGIGQFAQGFDLHTYDDYWGFFDCFASSRFRVTEVEMNSYLKVPMDPVADSIGIVLRNGFDRERFSRFVNKTYEPKRADMFLKNDRTET